jgi:hypothetical protein
LVKKYSWTNEIIPEQFKGKVFLRTKKMSELTEKELSSPKLIKIDKENQEKQNSNLPVVPCEIFESMIDNKGVSIAGYNKKGFKVLLFFVSFIGCPHCQGTLDDIVDD